MAIILIYKYIGIWKRMSVSLILFIKSYNKALNSELTSINWDMMNLVVIYWVNLRIL